MVKVPIEREGFISSWAQYTICFENNQKREQAIKLLKKNNIPTAVYYRKPMHMQEAFKRFKNRELEYKITEKICESCLSLPMHPYMSMNSIKKIVNGILELYY